MLSILTIKNIMCDSTVFKKAKLNHNQDDILCCSKQIDTDDEESTIDWNVDDTPKYTNIGEQLTSTILNEFHHYGMQSKPIIS
jgi:hypothetical protein